MSEVNWLLKVQAVDPTLDQLRADYDIDKVCSGDVYEMMIAMMARAINSAVDETRLSPRRKRRITERMGDHLLSGGVAVFMLGYDTAMKEHSAGLKEAANAQ